MTRRGELVRGLRRGEPAASAWRGGVPGRLTASSAFRCWIASEYSFIISCFSRSACSALSFFSASMKSSRSEACARSASRRVLSLSSRSRCADALTPMTADGTASRLRSSSAAAAFSSFSA